MTSGNIKTFCHSVLPENFNQVSRQVRRCQQALQATLPGSIGSMVQALTVEAGKVSIAANSPVVANYLRLHLPVIEQALTDIIGPKPVIEIKTRPASLASVPGAPRPAQPKPVNPEAIARLASSSSAIEDEALREAMQALAKTLASRSGNNG